jgi:hypothetical protein
VAGSASEEQTVGQLPTELLVTLLKLTVGVGLDDYYGPGSGASAFGAAGVTASFPLRFMPPGYGSWTFSVGGEAVLRDDDIRRLSRFDGDDSVIFIGHTAITVTY